jgi:epoxyqueuosine reductase
VETVSKEEVVAAARALGYDLVRVTSAEPFTDWAKAVRDRIAEDLIPMDSVQNEEPFQRPDEWADPRASLPEARSVVVVAMRYNVEPVPTDPEDNTLRGRLSRQAWRDFYGDLYGRRARLAEALEARGVRCNKRSCLPNKAAARRAGIGSYGVNGVITAPNAGSWMVITTVVTDAELDEDAPTAPACDSCRACIDACPTGAIVRPYVVDVGRCLCHVLAATGDIPREVRPLVGDRINGCDACQEACPLNKGASSVPDTFTHPRREWTERPALLRLLTLSDKEFKAAFYDMDLYRMEPQFMQRNALVALGNLRDPQAVPHIARVLRGPNPMLRAHAAWAIGSIGGFSARRALKDAANLEDDPRVLDEIEEARGE